MQAIEHMTVHGALASGIGYRDLAITIFFMYVLLVFKGSLVSTVRVVGMCDQEVTGLNRGVSFLQMQDKSAYNRSIMGLILP